MSINVKFIFANSNATLDFKIAKTASGYEIKQMLFGKWPKGLPPCRDPDRVRMICLGRVIQDDEEVVGNRHFKSDVPLPINVSVRPSAEEIQKIMNSKNIRDVSGSLKPIDAAESGRVGGGGGSRGSGGGSGDNGRRDLRNREGMDTTPSLGEVCQCALS